MVCCPVYNELLPGAVGNTVSVQVLNAVYSAATGLDNASLKYITSTLNAQGQLSYYRKQPKVSVSVLPFRKNPISGVIEKLETFTLKVTVSQNGRQLRSLNAYAPNSVLSTGTWYKLSVGADGIYKIDYDFLKKTVGVDPSAMSKMCTSWPFLEMAAVWCPI